MSIRILRWKLSPRSDSYFDNWRWAGVPFYIRSGKRLQKHVTEIAIQFKEVPHRLFDRRRFAAAMPNVLVIRIQPNEGISLRFAAKLPGQALRIRSVNMDFRYGSSFGVKPPEAYERLAAGLHAGRFDALRAARYGRARLGNCDADTGSLEKAGDRIFPTTKRVHGDHRAAFELIERDGKAVAEIVSMGLGALTLVFVFRTLNLCFDLWV